MPGGSFASYSNQLRIPPIVISPSTDLAGVPAICLPCGFSADGLPYSAQFTGRRLGESMLCRIAHAYERATQWHTRHPNVKTA